MDAPASRGCLDSSLGRGIAAVLVVFASGQALLVAAIAKGLSGDEAIYALAGLRLLDGQPLRQEGYAEWFNGSPLAWPLLSGLAYRIAGWAGARGLAVAFSCLALWFFGRAARNLFGAEAAFWGLLALALNGPLLALSHMATYDVPALAALGAAFFLVTECARTGGRCKLLVAGLVMALGCVAKYGYAFMLPALGGILLATRARPQLPLDLCLVVFVPLVALAGHSAALQGTLLPSSFWAYQSLASTTGRALVLAQQLYYLVPVAIAARGWAIASARGSARLASAILAPVVIWPLFHAVAGNAASANKHVVAGQLFAHALVGVALAELRRSSSRQTVACVWLGLGSWGAMQWHTHEFSYRDWRPVTQYLARHVQPGDTVYSSCGTWVHAVVLYELGLISGKDAVHDIGDTDPGTWNAPAACSSTLVAWDGAAGPREAVSAALRRCEYRTVFRYSASFVGVRDRRLGRHEYTCSIYERPGRFKKSEPRFKG